jgi:outer membrane protein TolC
MREHRSFIVSAFFSLLLSGCATSALEMAPDQPDKPWSPVTTANGQIIAGEQNRGEPTNGYALPANPALANIPPSPAVEASKVYSLPGLIDLAESNNTTTRIAWNNARRVALAAGIAESAYLPRITATAIGGYQGSSGSDSALGTSLNSNGSANGTISAVSLQWLLFDFGERAAVVEAAKQATVVSNIAFNAAHQQVIYNVTLAFYAHAATLARVATATRSLSNAQVVQGAAEDRYKHGIGTLIEVAQARQSTAQANLALVQATGGEKDAYLALLTAMGISPLTRINIADVTDRNLSPTMASSVETIVSESIGRRTDVLGADAARSASLANIRAAQAEFMPKIFLSAVGAYNAGNLNLTALPSAGQEPPTVNVNGHHFNGGIFVGVTIPLYDGGTRSAVLAQARAEADSADARLSHVRDEAVREIVAADSTLRTSLSAYEASKSLASAAQTTFDAALAAYQHGVGSITDLTLANSQLLQAKNTSTDAYNSALSAAAMLAFATGTLGAALE